MIVGVGVEEALCHGIALLELRAATLRAYADALDEGAALQLCRDAAAVAEKNAAILEMLLAES